MSTSPSNPAAFARARTRLVWEVSIVLLLTLGKSSVYSTLSLIRSLLAPTPLSGQTTSLNPTRDTEVLWDVIYGVLGVFFDLVPVALVIYLLWEPGASALKQIGLDLSRIGSDFVRALAVAAVIGVPGLGLYLAGRAMGLSVAVAASPSAPAWYLVPILILSALRAGLVEEVILLGYLGDRLRKLGMGTWAIIVSAAVLRGLYHSYQGAPAFFGNVVMGIVFGWAYQRWGRVMPLVIAHALIDTVAFVGYPFAAALYPQLFTAG